MKDRKCVICLCKGVCIGLHFAVLEFTRLKVSSKRVCFRIMLTTGSEIHMEMSFSNFVMNELSNFM